MFNTKFGPFNGSTWESLCQQVFKRKYQAECYQQMPASPGDYGIEGYTSDTGWAFSAIVLRSTTNALSCMISSATKLLLTLES